MAAPILATKLHIPPLPPKVVLRPQLVGRLMDGLNRKLGTRLNLDVYGGASFDGELSIEDASGGHISSEAYDLAPMVALQLSCEF